MLNRPDVIQGVHESMVEAGAEVVETDTFQASRLKLDEWGLAEHTHEINVKAAQIARKAVGENRFVAGSIGPTGFLPASEDPSLGQIRFRELVEVFREQSAGPARGRRRPADRRDRAGHPRGQGRDLRHARGVQDRRPQRADPGLRLACCPTAARCCWAPTSAPRWRRSRRSKVDVIGLNCSTGPEDMRDASASSASTRRCRCTASRTPASRIRDPDGETVFPENPDELANVLGQFVERYGVSIVGGCCGTTPDHIRAIKERCGAHEVGAAPRAAPAARVVA